MRLFYVPLEPYVERYTFQLLQWNLEVFDRLGLDYTVVKGTPLSDSLRIETGDVLDAHGRPYWALSQIMELTKLLRSGAIQSEDVIFFEDMFHPGVEALPYTFALSKVKPKVYMRCLAQTIDPDDFVHRAGMTSWMRHYEVMCSEFVDGILCASEEMIPFIRNAGWRCHLYVTGLPFGKDEVTRRAEASGRPAVPWLSRGRVVAWASRWDEEKQPHFFMDVMEATWQVAPDTKFEVLCGAKFRSSDETAVTRGRLLMAQNPHRFSIHENLSKDAYYQKLGEAKCLFNSSLQDWVSNTISEGTTLGALPCFPAYRSFPEACFNNPYFLYVPWSVEDAVRKLIYLLDAQPYHLAELQLEAIKIAQYQDGTIARSLEVLLNHPSAQGMLRGDGDHVGYRKHVNLRGRA